MLTALTQVLWSLVYLYTRVLGPNSLLPLLSQPLAWHISFAFYLARMTFNDIHRYRCLSFFPLTVAARFSGQQTESRLACRILSENALGNHTCGRERAETETGRRRDRAGLQAQRRPLPIRWVGNASTETSWLGGKGPSLCAPGRRQFHTINTISKKNWPLGAAF